MTHLGQGRRRPSIGVLMIAASLVAGLTVGVLTGVWSGQGEAHVAAPNRRTAEPGRTVTTLAAVPARRTGAPAPERPTASRLPDGTVVPIRPAGTTGDGALAVPDDIREAGWWRGGSRLGDPFGVTLLAAHVDSTTQGLGPYATLLSARAGQRIVLASRHLSQAFAVTSLRLVPRRTLARRHHLFSARGDRRLVLVTCAGPYDAARGGYQNLAVVTAVPTTEVLSRSSR
ncbi:class F sortase [Nocardioides cynanchi]|uniref:class F sortase n=1 Tax=Nocardioides cynanchi TaxID=2558918 RepID=UPI001246F2E3|nr:class F sortase [Nocardioides cynanchi]